MDYIDDIHRANAAGALVTKALNYPSMGVGGGSKTEEGAQDKHQAECIAELQRLRALSQRSQDPALHTILDAVAGVLRVE